MFREPHARGRQSGASGSGSMPRTTATATATSAAARAGEQTAGGALCCPSLTPSIRAAATDAGSPLAEPSLAASPQWREAFAKRAVGDATDAAAVALQAGSEVAQDSHCAAAQREAASCSPGSTFGRQQTRRKLGGLTGHAGMHDASQCCTLTEVAHGSAPGDLNAAFYRSL